MKIIKNYIQTIDVIDDIIDLFSFDRLMLFPFGNNFLFSFKERFSMLSSEYHYDVISNHN